MQEFISSLPGQALLVLVITVFLMLAFHFSPKDTAKNKAITLAVSAMMIALAHILNSYAVLFTLPNGGSITALSMLFMFLPGYLFGVRVGIPAAGACGLLDLLVRPSVYYPVQMFLDYPIAFGLVGLGALLRETKYGLISGYLLGVFSRFAAAFLSGAIFFAEYAPDGMNAFVYSAVYNISYLGPEAVITIILLAIPAVKNALAKIARTYGAQLPS